MSTPDARGSNTDSAPTGRSNVAAVICLLEGLILVGFCGFYLYELVLGQGDDPGRVVMSVALMGLFAVALLAAARAWRSGVAWPRTPTILWNLLLLPVAWNMWEGGFWGAWPVGVAAVLGIWAALTSGPALTADPAVSD